jgi:hypothetical protein
MGEPPLVLRGHSMQECSSILWSGRKGTEAVEKEVVLFLQFAKFLSWNNVHFTAVIKHQQGFF